LKIENCKLILRIGAICNLHFSILNFQFPVLNGLVLVDEPVYAVKARVVFGLTAAAGAFTSTATGWIFVRD